MGRWYLEWGEVWEEREKVGVIGGECKKREERKKKEKRKGRKKKEKKNKIKYKIIKTNN